MYSYFIQNINTINDNNNNTKTKAFLYETKLILEQLYTIWNLVTLPYYDHVFI